MNHYQDILYSTPVQHQDDYGSSRSSDKKKTNTTNAALSPPPMAPRFQKNRIRHLGQEKEEEEQPFPFVDFLMMPDLDDSTTNSNSDTATLDSYQSVDSTESSSIYFRLRPRTLSPPSSPRSILTLLEEEDSQGDYDALAIMARPTARHFYDPCPSLPHIHHRSTSRSTHPDTCSQGHSHPSYNHTTTTGCSCSPTGGATTTTASSPIRATSTSSSTWGIIKPSGYYSPPW